MHWPAHEFDIIFEKNYSFSQPGVRIRSDAHKNVNKTRYHSVTAIFSFDHNPENCNVLIHSSS